MSRTLLIVFLVFFSQSQYLAADSMKEMISLTSGQILDFLSNDSGSVLDHVGEDILVNIGTRNGVFEGEILDIAVNGGEIKDPVTGEVLGMMESSLCKVKVCMAHRNYSICKAPGDSVSYKNAMVRRNMNKAAIAFIPVMLLNFREQKEYANIVSTFVDGVTAELGKSGQIRVVDREKLDKAVIELKFSQSGIISPTETRQLGSFLGTDILVTPKVIVLPGELMIFLHLIGVETGVILKSFHITVPKDKRILQALKQKEFKEIPAQDFTDYTVRLK